MPRELALPLCGLISAVQFYPFSAEEMETCVVTMEWILLESAHVRPFLPALENIRDPLDLLGARLSVLRELDTHSDDPHTHKFQAWLLLRLKIRAVSPDQILSLIHI